MQYLNIALASLGSIIVLLIIAKVIGNKQISHMNMFDYIIGITIGAIAAEMATSLEGDFLKPLTALILYGLCAIIIELLMLKSVKARRILSGKSLILMDSGKLYYKNFKKARLDINEFLTQGRVKGYFNLGDIETAVFEPNGMISFLPASRKRPVSPADLDIFPEKDKPWINVILDGKVMEMNLKAAGNSEDWLNKKLKSAGIQNIEDVFLASCDGTNLNVYIKIEDKPRNDIFE